MSEFHSIVIGGGAVGVGFHVPRLFQKLKSDSVCIVDSNEDRCNQLKKRYANNKKITVCTTIPEHSFNMAVIATPPKYHLPNFQATISQCETFLIEKPLAKTFEEGLALAELADSHQRDVYIAMIRRSLGHFAMAREWIKNKVLGTLKSVRIAEGSVFSWNAVSQGSFSKDLNGGGVLMDTGPHTLDQLFQTFDKVTFESAKMDALPRSAKSAIEANAYLEMKAEDEIPVSLMLSRNRYLTNQAVFEFERASLCLSLHNNTVKLIDNNGHNLIGVPEGLPTNITYPELFDSYYENFLVKKDNSGVSPRESLKSQAIIEQAYAHAELVKGGF